MSSSNHELIVLKKMNKELRMKLKNLNMQMTKVLDNLSGKYQDKSFDQRMSPEVMEIEMENAENQIKFYEKEIAFLSKRLKDGDQIEQIENLQKECYGLAQDEEMLGKLQSALRNRFQVLTTKLKKHEASMSHKAKMAAMIEKRKAFTLQLDKLSAINKKTEEEIISQRKFTDLINERYLKACQEVGEEPGVKLTYNDEGMAVVHIKNELRKSAPQLRQVIFNKSQDKSKEMNFVRALMMDDPENYELPKTEEDFKRLKEKVKNMLQSARVEEKQSKLLDKTNTSKTYELEQRKEKIGRTC